jgi:SAM-dependent methyltransferase
MTEVSREAAAYWDENREKARDPTFWMAHPLCRQAINRRISGNPHEWPMDYFKRVHVRRPFARAVSFGCGLGSLERALVAGGIVAEIDAFDISSASLEDARREAEREGLRGIHYRIGDFNDPQLERRRYDIAFFHQSLHHVSSLERLFRRLARALRPGGLIYIDEYVGPSRTEWRPRLLGAAQAALDRIPKEARLAERILPPIEVNDPSEAVRSSEIPTFFSDFFESIEWRPYGGQIVDLVLPCTSNTWSLTPQGIASIGQMLDLEDDEMRADPAATHYVVAFGRLKPWRGLARPLLSQVRAAVARRGVRLAGRVGRAFGGPGAA